MLNNFYSWQYFSNELDFITKSQIEVLKNTSNDLNIPLYHQKIPRYNDINSRYSYLINPEKPNISGIIFQEYQDNLYMKYTYALNNIFSYIPYNELNLDDIKGFNLMDYVLVPTPEVKSYIENKIPNIKNVVFIPFNINIEIENPENKIALCIDPKEFKNIKDIKLINFLKNFKYDIYNYDNRSNLYKYISKYNLIIDFSNDFFSSIIQKKSIVNNIVYLGKNNIFSEFKALLELDDFTIEEKISLAKEYTINNSDILKNVYSELNVQNSYINFLNTIKENGDKRNFYIYKEHKNNLSYHTKLNKILSQIDNLNDFIISDQENLNQIISQKQQMINDKQGIIIIQKSEFYPDSIFNKNEFIEILKPLKLIRSIYIGSDETKLDNKEIIVMIFIKSDYDYKNINKKINVVWEGYQFFHISLAVINREIESRMIDNGNYELSISSHDYYQEIFSDYQHYEKLKYCIDKPLINKADFHIRHVYPTGLKSPQEGKYILIFPWEDGNIPDELVDHINKEVDELWCPSEYIKSLHINSGIINRKIHVIPNGIDLNIYKPKVEKLELKTNKKFKFLFVGGFLFRKGFDILLKAYFNEFNDKDDVCLIIKSLGKNTYYSSENNLINHNNPNNPEVIIFEENLNSEGLSSLYNSCDVYVHPYRAEGFGMPIFEAMACGLVPIVTKYGPSLEYCNDSNSFLINYENKENLKMYTFIEPDINDLQNNMRYAYNNASLIKSMSNQTVNAVQDLSWENIFKKVDERLIALKDLPEYRNNKEYYIDILKKDISENIDNTDILYELKFLCNEYEYKAIFANERYLKKDYKKSLELYTELYNKYKNNIYLQKIIELLDLLGDTKTSDALKKKLYN